MKSIKNNTEVQGVITKKRWLVLLPAFMLILAIFKMPYYYYFYLRIIVFLFSVYYFLQEFKNNKNILFTSSFIMIALIFNPFIPFQFSRQIWFYIDISSFLLYLFYFFKTTAYFEKSKNILLNYSQLLKEKFFEWLGVLGFIIICIIGMYIKSDGRLFLSQEKILELDKQEYQQAIDDGEVCSPEDVKNDNYTEGCRVMTFDDYMEDKEQKEDEEAEMQYNY